LDDEEEGVTDTEDDVASDDDASTAGDDSDADKEEEQSDGAEDMPVPAAEVDSDDEGNDEEDVSAAALLGLDVAAVLPGDPFLAGTNGDIEVIEEAGDTPAIEDVSMAVFDDDSSPHSELIATPSSDPLPGSPPSLAPAPHSIVLSPPHDSLPHNPPPATPPYNEVLISVEEDLHPVCKAPTAVSRVADMPTDSLACQNDPHVHEKSLTLEKLPSNGDLSMGDSQELVSTPQLSVTYDSDAERPELPANGTSQSVPGVVDNTGSLPEEDEAGSAAGDEFEEDTRIPRYLKHYAVAPVEWDPNAMIKPPALLRGILRPYQQAGLEWLASIHASNLNCILADEMGLGCVPFFSPVRQTH
jgi:helicase SWR1